MLELFEGVEIFSGLKREELNELVDYCGCASYDSGDTVFSEGELSSRFYIVSRGSVAILRTQENEDPAEIARFVSGEPFGEMDLIENAPRSASAVAAVPDTELLLFPGPDYSFSDLLREKPLISAKMLKAIIAIIAGRIRTTNRLISEKAPWIQELKRQLMTDKLTGLLNRTYLDEEFVTRIDEYGESSAILMVKPDNFKYINDSFGHETGDEVLRRIAERFKDQMKDGYEAVRYRGNELSVIIPDADLSGAEEAAREIKRGMDSVDISDLTGGEKPSLTFSAGAAVYPLDSRNPSEIISLSHSRLYRSVEEGGDRITGGWK